jgi:hypothetical protein
MKKIVGLCGMAGSGKGTVGNILVEKHGFVPLSFAEPLKDAVARIFSWDRTLLEGDSQESRTWRELPCPFWSKVFGKPITPRYILQYIGTDVFRNIVNKNVWVESLIKKIDDAPDGSKFVITDVRFENEMDRIRSIGGVLVLVQRGPLPHWYDDAVSCNGYSETGWNGCIFCDKYPDLHPSEYSWAGYPYYHSIIKNDGGFDALCENVESRLSDYIVKG